MMLHRRAASLVLALLVSFPAAGVEITKRLPVGLNAESHFAGLKNGNLAYTSEVDGTEAITFLNPKGEFLLSMAIPRVLGEPLALKDGGLAIATNDGLRIFNGDGTPRADFDAYTLSPLNQLDDGTLWITVTLWSESQSRTFVFFVDPANGRKVGEFPVAGSPTSHAAGAAALAIFTTESQGDGLRPRLDIVSSRGEVQAHKDFDLCGGSSGLSCPYLSGGLKDGGVLLSKDQQHRILNGDGSERVMLSFPESVSPRTAPAVFSDDTIAFGTKSKEFIRFSSRTGQPIERVELPDLPEGAPRELDQNGFLIFGSNEIYVRNGGRIVRTPVSEAFDVAYKVRMFRLKSGGFALAERNWGASKRTVKWLVFNSLGSLQTVFGGGEAQEPQPGVPQFAELEDGTLVLPHLGDLAWVRLSLSLPSAYEADTRLEQVLELPRGRIALRFRSGVHVHDGWEPKIVASSCFHVRALGNDKLGAWCGFRFQLFNRWGDVEWASSSYDRFSKTLIQNSIIPAWQGNALNFLRVSDGELLGTVGNFRRDSDEWEYRPKIADLGRNVLLIAGLVGWDEDEFEAVIIDPSNGTFVRRIRMPRRYRPLEAKSLSGGGGWARFYRSDNGREKLLFFDAAGEKTAEVSGPGTDAEIHQLNPQTLVVVGREGLQFLNLRGKQIGEFTGARDFITAPFADPAGNLVIGTRQRVLWISPRGELLAEAPFFQFSPGADPRVGGVWLEDGSILFGYGKRVARVKGPGVIASSERETYRRHDTPVLRLSSGKVVWSDGDTATIEALPVQMR